MTWWEAALLGLVEGLTEYLPVSSTGHLVLAQRVMGIPESPAANAYAICIQAGAILAVLGLYAGRVGQMLTGALGALGLSARKDPTGLRLAVNLVAAFLPAAVVGLLFDDLIESYLFGLWPVVCAWFVGGAAILGVAWWRRGTGAAAARDRSLESMTWRMALAIGFVQCLAMWPGTSRSLVTIVGGVLAGLSLAAAVEFSFLLGVLTLLAATVYKAKDAGPLMLEAYGWWPMLVGSVTAWIAAVVAVKWMVAYLRRNGLQVFGYYRVALAIVVGGLLAADVLAEGAPPVEVPSQPPSAERP